MDVWIVDSKDNTDFFSEYPMVGLPFVLLLNKNKRIAAIDPAPLEFNRQVSLLTTRKTDDEVTPK